jgi:uncharacterized protein YecE (DUF72 family)
MPHQARIGISGWRYPPWRGTFYPPGLPQKDELSFASRQLNFIEINGSFYSLQRPSSYIRWRDATPNDFVFSVKGSRYITHMLKLENVRTPLANFLASGVLALGKKLGPFLWQFPPRFAFNADKLAAFFDLLPRDTTAMSKLARKHDARMNGRSFLQVLHRQPLRHCVEIRHESFVTPEFPKLLKRHDIGLVVADTAGKWPLMEDVTADFVYCRLHGDKELYVSGYTDKALDTWAAKLRRWRRTRDVYVAFDNDVKVRAPIDAIHLAERLGVAAGEARAHEHEARLADRKKHGDHKPPVARQHWPGFSRRQAG